MHGYFGSGSIAWRLGKEFILTLGGGRAVLMQLAHPLVAMGVSAHSSYLSDPFGRTERTFLLGQMLTFGNATVAREAARTINQLHSHVRGSLPLEAGAFAQGTTYFARDPDLLFWVQATLVDTILQAYPLFIGPLSHEEQEQYYQESKMFVRLLGLTESAMPATVDDLRCYVDAMVCSNRLAATPQAREIARQVLYPPVPDMLRPLCHLNRWITSALLPPQVRELYGLEWGPKRQWVFERAAAALRIAMRLLPERFHTLPMTKRLMEEEESSPDHWPFSWLARALPSPH